MPCLKDFLSIHSLFIIICLFIICILDNCFTFVLTFTFNNVYNGVCECITLSHALVFFTFHYHYLPTYPPTQLPVSHTHTAAFVLDHPLK